MPMHAQTMEERGAASSKRETNVGEANTFKKLLKMENCPYYYAVLMAIACAALSACTPVNPNDLPVSHWADPKTIGADGFGYSDECSVASAQAILKSGLPFPNYGTKDEWDAYSQTMRKRITTVDYWLGGTRFVFPAEISASSNYPLHNPHRYKALAGTLPHFYPKGPPAPNKDGMGAMVDVQFVCSMDPRFTAFMGPTSNEDGIKNAKARYQADMEIPSSIEKSRKRISVVKRDDLQMTEVLYERGGIYNDGQPMWEASYWPLHRELRDNSSAVVGIGCQIRNDPAKIKRYGGRGWRCTTAISILPNVAATIDIYVSHLEHMPSIFDQVQQVINDARKAGERK